MYDRYTIQEVHRMKKRIVLYIVFVLLLVFWIITSVTGVMLWLKPIGHGLRSGLRKLPAYQVHLYIGLAFTMLCVIHIALNWKWVTSAIKAIFRGSK